MAKHPEPPTLLRELSQMGSYGRAEGENNDRFPKTFHPITNIPSFRSQCRVGDRPSRRRQVGTV